MKTKANHRHLFIALPLLLASGTPAFAHHAEFMSENPLLQGLSMPAHGLDHLLSIFAIGLVAAHAGPWVRHRLPLLFAAIALIGGLLNLKGISLPEFAVPLSVAACAGLLWRNASRTGAVLAGLTVFAGVCNGQALLPEPSASGSGLLFALGCILSALGLAYAGVCAGSLLRTPRTRHAVALLLVCTAAALTLFPSLNAVLITFLESPR